MRSYEARNNLRAMAAGDLALFYHSNAEPPGVAGVVEVVRAAHPDPSQFDPKSPGFEPRATPAAPLWDQVEVRLVAAFPRLIPIGELRALPALRGMVLFKRGRLSVQPVALPEWEAIISGSGLQFTDNPSSAAGVSCKLKT